jgi:RHH-type proline utilization regulon transcriptional repressor/proline dehydrogenase/delta 1-pyrroline-5-carboxylate dehydrogenase
MTAAPKAAEPSARLRQAIRAAILADEAAAVANRVVSTGLSADDRQSISRAATDLVRAIRQGAKPGIMETFLAEYGLSTDEGVALMCLAEALLRVPDPLTIDDLIQDKITPADWGKHLGQSSSPLVNASTWALMLTGRVLADAAGDNLITTLRGIVRRLGEPVVRTAVSQAMRELGEQFVLGQTIDEAAERARALEEQDYTYSYDMLGEAARTDTDAKRYHIAYSDAISSLAGHCNSDDVRDNPGISVKLSALHPRYEFGQAGRMMPILAARTRSLALLAKSANMGFNIDAEEADRLDLSLDLIEQVLAEPALADWDGFGIVVQAYGLRATYVLDWLHDLARRLDRRIMVRLVKGAYWDSEIKRAHVLGLAGFPVYTRKAATDVAYIACARQLFTMADRVYPQFATHNAHTVSAVLHMAGSGRYEFQRLHGMGEALYETLRTGGGGQRCRIYAPVGAHEDLLAYLVRRLLENGANSSFVHQIVDEEVPAEEIARDPIAIVESWGKTIANPAILPPADLYGPDRRAAKGWDLTDPNSIDELDRARGAFRRATWHAGPMVAGSLPAAGRPRDVRNPADTNDVVGRVTDATEAEVAAAVAAAASAQADWAARPVADRAAALRRLADLYEQHAPELFALAAREAGKTLADGVAEVREAVDFCRYYATQAERLDRSDPALHPRGTVACISPWNFPLAIFTGQIAAALVTGNAVIAKPAEQTPLIAARAVQMMHEAGIPDAIIQLLPGDGAIVGARLVSTPGIDGVLFTGSTETARLINRAMAENLTPEAPLIAETGGLNAMIVDSTALPEQAVRDIIASAFQGAGQRCSALRILYLQKDVEDRVLAMLFGAMDALTLGDPWSLSTDVGPVIDAEAKAGIDDHCQALDQAGRRLKRLDLPAGAAGGLFVAPAVYRVSGIEDLEREVFGPILHVAPFDAAELDQVLEAINARGYGLTLGLHTRVDDRVQRVVDWARVGNLYVNRNQIGAVVGSQPFGGEGLSGTGPKAGGPHYLRRLMKRTDGGAVPAAIDSSNPPRIGAQALTKALTAVAPAAPQQSVPVDLPGPTGESNRLTLHPRGAFVCLSEPGAGLSDALMAQTNAALYRGVGIVMVAPGAAAFAKDRMAAGARIRGIDGSLGRDALAEASGFAGVISAGSEDHLRRLRQILSARDSSILPLVTPGDDSSIFWIERTLSVDTTAAGGNATLLAETED